MKSKLLKISNYALFLSMCVTLSAGLILEYRLPSGPQNRGVHLLGLARHDWTEVHFICAISFIAIALLHLCLNWSWITKVAAHGNRILLFISLGVGLLLIIIPFVIPLEQTMRTP